MKEKVMETLSIALFGSFTVAVQNELISTFESNKVRALLAYLVVEASITGVRPHQRSALAALLWPDYPEEMARTNLRHVLRQLRQTLPEPAGSPPLLLTDKQTIQINPNHRYALDVARFDQLLTAARRCSHRTLADCADCPARCQEAAALYRGDFLAGLSLYDSEPFDEWVVVQREGFHRQALELFFTLASYHEAQGEYAQAQHYAQRQLQLEPWREEAHRQLMRVLAVSGQRTTALAQYNQCRKTLADELGVEPDAETVALYEQIRSGKFDKVTSDLPVILSPLHPVTLSPLQDWGEAPATSYFYGRQAETKQLERWISGERCQLIVILGMGGMGKTTLATHVARTVAGEFEFVFWRSLLNAPPLTDLLRHCLHFLTRQQLISVPTTLPEQLTLLLAYLSRQRCLIVLDNAESILSPDQPGQYRAGYEGYGQLIERVAQRTHQSCLVVTSRERPHGVGRLEEDIATVRTLPLEGLGDEAGQTILRLRGLGGNTAEVTTLVQRYSGNPLALKLVARTIQDLFDGDMTAFLDEEVVVFDDIRTILTQQFVRLSPLEREILIWLAVEREAIAMDDLAQNLVWMPARRDLLEALRALQRRSLLEKQGAGFTLQNVVTEFLIDYLVTQVGKEIEQGAIDLLNRYALLKAQAKEYVRQSQVRLILQPIASQLVTGLGRAALRERVQQMLAALRAGVAPLAPGYAGGNLLNLLLHLGVDVARFDFSQISVRQAYLRGRYVPGLNLTNADLTGAAFTHIFGNIHGLRFRPHGELLVFGSSEGMMRLWRASDGALLYANPLPDPAYLFIFMDDDSQVVALSGGNHAMVVVDVVHARVLHTFAQHHSPIWRLAFSKGGRWAASGDASGQIYLWATAGGATVHSLRGHQQPISALAFAPDGSLLASADVAGTICLWQVADGALRHSFQGHAEEVAMLQFALGGAVLASASNDHTVRLWDVEAPGMARPLHLLAHHTQPVLWLAVSPNGQTLASGGNDNFVVLWDAVIGQALHILADHAAPLNGLAFSQDSGQLAALDTNETISVWDVANGQRLDSYRIHHGGIQAVATSPDGRYLLSGGMDWAVYLWEISNPAAAHLINRLAGHQQRVRAVAFSRDGSTAASGDQSGEIRLWRLRDMTSRTLRGHTGGIAALAYSPDNRHLVSAGDDGTLCVWDLRYDVHTLVLRGHTNCVGCCAFSPAPVPAQAPGGFPVPPGSETPHPQWIASGSMDRTVRLWDTESGQLRHTLHGHTNSVQQVCFSPDGRHLVSSSFDESYCLWDVTTGELLARWPTQNTTYLALAIHPNGKIMAAGGRDSVTRLVEIESGRVIEELHGHERTVESISLCPISTDSGASDAWLLATAGHDETIKLWDITAVGTAPGAAVCLATLRAPGPYAGMNIRGVTGVSDAQKAALKALGAVEE